jgi:hypothetical protein
MEDATEGYVYSQEKPVGRMGVGWQILWFLSHLAVVYAIVNVCTPFLARGTHDTLLPLLQHSSSGRFEYLYSHLFVLSFIPDFVAGLVNARFRHKAAQFVWLLPAVILAYKFAMFPSPSVLQGQLSAAFHQHSGGGFTIPDFRNWHEFLSIAGSNSDMARGRAQTNLTAPYLCWHRIQPGGVDRPPNRTGPKDRRKSQNVGRVEVRTSLSNIS